MTNSNTPTPPASAEGLPEPEIVRKMRSFAKAQNVMCSATLTLVGIEQVVSHIDALRTRLEQMRDDRDAIRKQLPYEMQDCTIVFKQCSRGHGWLTATNWVQHGCPACEIRAAESALATEKVINEHAVRRRIAAERRCAELEKDARCFVALQNMEPIQAQQFFWNFKSRTQRKDAILAALAAEGREDDQT